MENNKIAHLADLHVRFGTRHNEIIEVFKKTTSDLKIKKPRRIVIAGDLFHMKINLSPNSIGIVGDFLAELSLICPVDIIVGNHDTNMQAREQGDSITPIVNLLKNGFIITENTKPLPVPKNGNGVYFFKDSGFYEIDNDIIYGVYSCLDNKIFKLTDKNPNKKYIALYHGPVYGARLDNGYENKNEDNIKPSVFNNFDAVFLGDFHEFQVVQEYDEQKHKPLIIFPGSLMQQNYGESIDKGYVLWDIENISYTRCFVPNDFGFAKITIAKGEKFEERIEHIKFSSNKKKTKVYVVWEDYEENFSQEKENQIVKLVKDKHGCEIVKVQFETIIKEIVVTEGEEEVFKESEEYFKEFITGGDYNCTKEEIKYLLDIHRETNQILQISEGEGISSNWSLNKVEVSNIFSFPVKETIIDFDTLGGITGVFGENYNGKSNFIKAMVWGLYKEILGGGDPRYIVNIYTDSNKGHVKIWLTIDGKKFYIERTVKTTKKKDGSTSNSYSILYKNLELEYDEDGNLDNEKWENEKSDDKTAEKKEVEKLVEHAIGTFDDFTKSSLQTQGGKDDYLSMQQQPKNSLVSKYLGLEPYKLRYDYRKDFFNDIKKKQKELGDKIEIEEQIKVLSENKDAKNLEYENAVSEKQKANANREKTDSEILVLTKKIEKVEIVTISDPIKVNTLIGQHESEALDVKKSIKELESWLLVNFKKELPFDKNITEVQLTAELNKENGFLIKEKKELEDLVEWLKNNFIKKEISTISLEEEVDALKIEITQLNGLLDTFKGKSCPTCGHVHEKANPHKEEECLDNIQIKKELLKHKQEKIKQNNESKIFNTNHKNNASRKDVLLQTIANREEKIDSLKNKIEIISKSQDIILHNKKVETNSTDLNTLKDKLNKISQDILHLKETLVKIENNKSKEKNNSDIQIKIDALSELTKAYKLTVFNLDKQVTNLFGEIKVIENNIQSSSNKLIDIKEYEMLYRKYSIYLQAMHRDGIPALIIRKKLPLINHRINTILQQAVDFKLELDILANGDIVESFYFSDEKSDLLPLPFASGSQKFVSVIAIKDALHYISSLPKPSLCIIDEGFGTLDDKLTFEIMNILNYLKNKHKNVIVITHRNEIKDFADNIIDVVKVTTGISKEVLDKNPKAGITKLTII